MAVPGRLRVPVEQGGPAWATWIAVAGALVALVVGLWRLRSRETTAAVASALLLLPTFVHGLSEWTPSAARPPSPLTPGLVEALRDDGPAAAVVFSDPRDELPDRRRRPGLRRNAPPGHVADTKRNRPYERRDESRRFIAPATSGSRSAAERPGS